eukprot:3107730-Ditylum_brightwellii.AAC.1
MACCVATTASLSGGFCAIVGTALSIVGCSAAWLGLRCGLFPSCTHGCFSPITTALKRWTTLI